MQILAEPQRQRQQLLQRPTAKNPSEIWKPSRRVLELMRCRDPLPTRKLVEAESAPEDSLTRDSFRLSNAIDRYQYTPS